MKIYFSLLLFHRLFLLEYVFTYIIILCNKEVDAVISLNIVRTQTSNRQHRLESVEKRSKLCQNNKSRERALNFDQ